MTQEEKDLLVKDLCARLPYGVKISIPDPWINEEKVEVLNEIFKGDDGLYRVNDSGMLIKYIKPYLFPLSNMTSKQRAELSMLVANEYDMLKSFLIEIEFYHKHHFDYRGLIGKGLAVDCTNLNIY